IGLDHAEWIDKVISDDVPGAPGSGVIGKQRLRIAAKLKPRVLKELAKMNITGASLFPGLDGVGEYLQAASRFLATDHGVELRAEAFSERVSDVRAERPASLAETRKILEHLDS
ncbi:MAG: hypothetical protein H7Y88_10735, partial [Phycisphaerales bacterium]|nr:hypothetical protein [Phycisphaerales bacterium]